MDGEFITKVSRDKDQGLCAGQVDSKLDSYPNNTDFSGNEKIDRGTGNGWNRVGNRFYRLETWGHNKRDLQFLVDPLFYCGGSDETRTRDLPA